MNYDNIGQKLPNGKVKVIKSNKVSVGTVFESDSDFYKAVQSINESANPTSSIVLECIND